MKIFISVDMEGVAGVVAHEQTSFTAHDFDRARELMIGEVNAAVEGALAAGAEEVLVCDAHSRMINLLPEKMHSQACLINGTNKPVSPMMAGLDAACRAVILIGYHAKDGTPSGVLNHTYSPKALKDLVINGRSMGEIGLNSALAGDLGVPVCFISGDSAAVAEAQELMPWVRGAAVKEGLGRYSAASLHPAKARALIASGVKAALADLSPFKPLDIASPVTMDLTLGDTTMADLVEMIPGVQRTGGKVVRFIAPDFPTAHNFFRVALIIAGSAWNKEY